MISERIKFMAKKSVSKLKKNYNIIGWMFAMPAIIGFIFLYLIPMISSAFYSLSEFNAIGSPKYIGLDNYIHFFDGSDPAFMLSVKATLTYAVIAVPANMVFAFSIALLLNRKMVGRTFFRAVFYFPSIVPAVAFSFCWLLLMNPDFGLFNTILSALHLPTSNWLWSESTVIPSIVFMGIWGTGATQIIFLAGLQNIPKVYYEAVEIDGGNFFRKFIHVTLPMISPTLFFNLVMGVIGALQVFNEAYIMTKGGPNNASLFYIYNLWRNAFSYMKMGTAAAMAWLMFIVVIALTAIIFKTSNRWVYYESGDK